MILVTGGAGYIGSVTVELLRQRDCGVVVLDNLCHGHRAAVAAGVPFYEGDIDDAALVRRIVDEHGIEACIHFAAFINVGESVARPLKYYRNNVAKGMALLGALCESGVKQLVFSSTCATYGEPRRVPIDEKHPQWPRNPYGWSKLMMERAMFDTDAAHGLRFVALRYFNASGALDGHGEDHDPETHLIPNVLAVALGRRTEVTVFGDDYDTPDGTAVRDYIHVADLGLAHIQALAYLADGGASGCFNVGTGDGYSVLEVIESARRVTGHAIPANMHPRRAGDASWLVADARRARRALSWEPVNSDLDSIVRTAWHWHASHPDGYEA